MQDLAGDEQEQEQRGEGGLVDLLQVRLVGCLQPSAALAASCQATQGLVQEVSDAGNDLYHGGRQNVFGL